MNLETLANTAAALVSRGKGILAIDESLPTIAKRFASIGIESSEAHRRAYRELLITAPDCAGYISGMILFDETLRQRTDSGQAFPQVLQGQGILPGIKVDTGARDLAGCPNEKVTEGLDGLRDRLQEYRDLGACFAKWRAVITIGAERPSAACLVANAHALARYAALCQEMDVVPVIEPEVLMDGTHDMDACDTWTGQTLNEVFAALRSQRVSLGHVLLKVNMVVAGMDCPEQPGIEEVADRTVACLLRAVPAVLPGIVFLSGGQDAELATRHLNAINARHPALPWPLSFSYGRALQAPCLKIWAGCSENVAAAQAALLHRARCNSAASLGQYAA